MKKNKKSYKTKIIIILLLLLVGSFFFSKKAKENEKKMIDDLFGKEIVLDTKEFDDQGANHIRESNGFDYNSNPPTSGPHFVRAASWGFYEDKINDESAIHALEHGGIWVSYKDVTEEEKDILKQFFKENSQSVVISPREKNDSKIAIMSWGRSSKFDNVNLDILRKYILLYKNTSPEPIAK